MWELVGRHEPHQHTDGRRTKYFNFLVPCNPLLGFRDEVRATRRDSERDDSAKTRRIMRASPGCAGHAHAPELAWGRSAPALTMGTNRAVLVGRRRRGVRAPKWPRLPSGTGTETWSIGPRPRRKT